MIEQHPLRGQTGPAEWFVQMPYQRVDEFQRFRQLTGHPARTSARQFQDAVQDRSLVKFFVAEIGLEREQSLGRHRSVKLSRQQAGDGGTI